ncbi:MAG: FHA domain-containing protein [Deltaproteobacteria bacterium]|nr:FHA domain-containing protein [Deltaproteobacteria bacterium]
MGARVLWRDAQGREGSLDLTGSEATIGRAIDCAIRTDDAMVSRHHARLIWQGGQYFLEDLSSANGIFFQERRVNRHPLKHGDAVRCGSLWIRFLDSGGYSQQQISQPQPNRGAAMPSGMSPMGLAGQVPPRPPAQQGARSGRTAYLPPEDGGGLETPGPGPSPRLPPRPGPAPGRVAGAPNRPMPQQGSGPAVAGPVGPSHARHDAMVASQPPAQNARELRHLQRRVEQLKAELRVYRGGGDDARTYEELEEEIDNLTRERNDMGRKIQELERILREDGASAKVQRAGAIAKTASDIVSGLNDVLSNLRINVMAAEGEFEQFASALPRASFELIREALRSSATDMETAREMLRELRKLAGVS